jgi:hypothetical protein
MKSRATKYSGFVEHPRFGKGPRVTGIDVADSSNGSVYCHWHSPPGIRIPNTAVVADVSRQGRATIHVTHYFDARRVCRKCGSPFLFFAEEQKHWYEDLRFPLEADCLECAPCRKDEQRVRAVREKYEALLKKTPRVEADTLELVESGLFLVESAVFSAKLLPRLRGFLRLLLLDVEGPHFVRARELLSTIEQVTSK